MREPRPFPWSVWRELWENRSITLAPLLVAAVVLFACFISALTLPHRMAAILALEPGAQRGAIHRPFDFAAGIMIVTAFLVGVFYCLDALHGERRDRSILFWKSLPVSDLTTVLAKAFIPLALLPALVFAIVFAVQTTTLLFSSAMLLGHGPALAAFWSRLPIVQLWVAFLYALVAIALWHAPLYGLLLFVSGFARRAAFLWAALPAIAISVFEKIAFGTTHFAAFLGHRLVGWFTLAFVQHERGSVAPEPLAAMTPGRLLSSPGLWLGLVFAAGFLAAAVRLRRYREPI
jgi:ABC-2 type transport system permease protein